MAEAPPAPVVLALVVVETAFVAALRVALVVAVLEVLPAVAVVDAAPLVTVAVLVEERVALLDAIEPSVPETVVGPASASFPEHATKVIQQVLAKHRHRRSFGELSISGM